MIKPSSIKHVFRYIVFLILLPFIAAVLNYFLIENGASPWIFKHPEKIPSARVGLVLGTSKFTQQNRPNLYYRYRLNAAEKLFKQGKIRYILVSGDNSSKYYNEPLQMKKDLIKKGIPAGRIIPDYAGFSTYDSMMRAKEIFGLDTLIVISQNFHVRRAVYIGRKLGMHPFGYVAQTPENFSQFRLILREFLARIKATYDIWIKKKPKFLGKKIPIPQ